MNHSDNPISHPYNSSTSFGEGFEKLLEQLRRLSSELEPNESWPGKQLELLAESRVLAWVIPQQYGGMEITLSELVWGYQQLASSCLSTAFVLTQRNGACQRIAGSENSCLKEKLLPDLCRGKTFATVGISHLTTSRQYLGNPAMRVERTGTGFVFNGRAPWVTGANHADFIVTGGTCEDGKQILAAVPGSQKGVTIQKPPSLLALNASQTGGVAFEDVLIDESYLIAGPVEQVMKKGTGGGTGSLTTTAIALGASRKSLEGLNVESEKRNELKEIAKPLEEEYLFLEEEIQKLAAPETVDTPAELTLEAIRQRANSLVLRASQAYLGAAKGAGFVQGHPAELAVREAMFFLVWSCPQAVLQANLRELACSLE